MARIRSIYPNTPTDPDLAAIPIPGRLLFIYSWTIADDAGNLERNPRGMKMALFPGDDSMTVKKIVTLTENLIAGRFYEPYEVAGKAFLHVRSFISYQKPDHPTPPRFPLYPGQTHIYHLREGNSWISKTVSAPNSTNVPRTDGEHTGNVLAGSGLGRERKGKEVDLEGNGEDGRGTGREGEHDARPLALEGQAAPSSGKDKSTPTASGKRRRGADAIDPLCDPPKKGAGGNGSFLDFTDSLSQLKRESMQHALNLSSGGDSEVAIQHLKAAGFVGPELSRAMHLLGEGRTA